MIAPRSPRSWFRGNEAEIVISLFRRIRYQAELSGHASRISVNAFKRAPCEGGFAKGQRKSGIKVNATRLLRQPNPVGSGQFSGNVAVLTTKLNVEAQ